MIYTNDMEDQDIRRKPTTAENVPTTDNTLTTERVIFRVNERDITTNEDDVEVIHLPRETVDRKSLIQDSIVQFLQSIAGGEDGHERLKKISEQIPDFKILLEEQQLDEGEDVTIEIDIEIDVDSSEEEGDGEEVVDVREDVDEVSDDEVVFSIRKSRPSHHSSMAGLAPLRSITDHDDDGDDGDGELVDCSDRRVSVCEDVIEIEDMADCENEIEILSDEDAPDDIVSDTAAKHSHDDINTATVDVKVKPLTDYGDFLAKPGVCCHRCKLYEDVEVSNSSDDNLPSVHPGSMEVEYSNDFSEDNVAPEADTSNDLLEADTSNINLPAPIDVEPDKDFEIDGSYKLLEHITRTDDSITETDSKSLVSEEIIELTSDAEEVSLNADPELSLSADEENLNDIDNLADIDTGHTENIVPSPQQLSEIGDANIEERAIARIKGATVGRSSSFKKRRILVVSRVPDEVVIDRKYQLSDNISQVLHRISSTRKKKEECEKRAEERAVENDNKEENNKKNVQRSSSIRWRKDGVVVDVNIKKRWSKGGGGGGGKIPPPVGRPVQVSFGFGHDVFLNLRAST